MLNISLTHISTLILMCAAELESLELYFSEFLTAGFLNVILAIPIMCSPTRHLLSFYINFAMKISSIDIYNISVYCFPVAQFQK